MKKCKLFDFRRYGVWDAIFHLRGSIFSAVIFMAGFIIGIAVYASDNITDEFAEMIFVKFCAVHGLEKFWPIFATALLWGLAGYAVLFLFGCSLFGVVLVPITAAGLGCGYGCLAAFLYHTYSVKGAALYAILMVPAGVIWLLGFFSLMRLCVRFAFCYAKLTVPHAAPAALGGEFCGVCRCFIKNLLTVVAAAALDGILSKFFFPFFHLSV